MAYAVGASSTRPYTSLVNDEAVNAVIGQPVYSDSAGGFKLALGDGSAKAAAIGIVVDPTIRPAASGNVLLTGPITATTAQWDAVCGTSGGLANGVTYYLSTTIAGALTTSSTSGVAIIEGLSPTQAKIVIGCGGSGGGASATFPLTNASGSLQAAGTPVYSSAASSFAPAVATSSATATVVGLLASDCAIGAVGSVQDSEPLTLTTTQWDARTGQAGGLTFGKLYYLDTTAGKLVIETGTLPTAGQFLTLIGMALSTTQLRLLIQPPIGL